MNNQLLLQAVSRCDFKGYVYIKHSPEYKMFSEHHISNRKRLIFLEPVIVIVREIRVHMVFPGTVQVTTLQCHLHDKF